MRTIHTVAAILLLYLLEMNFAQAFSITITNNLTKADGTTPVANVVVYESSSMEDWVNGFFPTETGYNNTLLSGVVYSCTQQNATTSTCTVASDADPQLSSINVYVGWDGSSWQNWGAVSLVNCNTSLDGWDDLSIVIGGSGGSLDCAITSESVDSSPSTGSDGTCTSDCV